MSVSTKEDKHEAEDDPGNSLKVKSVVWAPVKYENKDQILLIVVVEGNRPALLGKTC